jgi:hypothetical protein
MTFLSGSRRCRLFDEIASNTWRHVIRNHRTGVQVSEMGRTYDIVAEIRDSYLADNNIGIWCNPGFKEIEHGSDLDVFVETRPGIFVWWALQAKVLMKDGAYKGLKGLHNGQYQWDLLKRLEERAGCFTRYLLYNGVANYSHENVNDGCNRPFEPDQYGCSLVETTTFMDIALSKVPRFRDFHPDHAEPWRIIPCCLVSTKREDLTYYSLAQVKNSMNYYTPAKENPQFFFDEDSLELNSSELNRYPVSAISNFSEGVGREPIARMVLRSTVSLNG